MGRKLIVAGNWKMNLSRAAAVALAEGVASEQASAGVEVAVFPTFPWIAPVSEALAGSEVVLGAQDCYVEDAGAFTGEVSPAALAELCTAVLAGHSERRHLLGETDVLVEQKVSAIIRNGLTVYLCVGETLEEREAGQAEAVVHRQLESGLINVDENDLDRVVIAYEPVWAIGTGLAASAGDAQEMCRSVRDWMGNRFRDEGREVRILYGGSCSPTNVPDLFSREDVDGGLVGGASLDADTFGQLIRVANDIAAV